jgi:hypothetical protein
MPKRCSELSGSPDHAACGMCISAISHRRSTRPHLADVAAFHCSNVMVTGCSRRAFRFRHKKAVTLHAASAAKNSPVAFYKALAIGETGGRQYDLVELTIFCNTSAEYLSLN